MGGIISAVIVGAIIGGLGQLIVPGDQDLAIWKSILLGIVAGLLGGVFASVLGLGDIAGFIIGVALAAGGVFLGIRQGLISTKSAA